MSGDTTNAGDVSSGNRGRGLSPRRLVRVVLAAFLLLIVMATILWRWRHDPLAKRLVGPDDPNSLRLLYVRPDCGEQVYDANGLMLGKQPVGNTYGYWWGPDVLKREFVFSSRIEGGNILFPSFVRVHLNGDPARRDIAWLEVGDADDSWVTYHCYATLPRTMGSGGFRLGPIRIPPRRELVRTVDAHVNYYAGPRGPARATFAGPFRSGQFVQAQENANILMQVKRSYASQLNFVFFGPPPVEHDAPVIAYTEEGQRCFLDRGSGRTSSSQGFRWECRARNLSLKSLTHITLDEIPSRQVYRGIKVTYGDLDVRTYPAFLDEVVARLDLKVDLSTEEAVRDFTNNREPLNSPSEALRILDVAQGNWLYRATRTLQRTKLADLTVDEKQRLASILASWRGGDREISAWHLGIWAGWPEYVDRALAILRPGDMADQRLRHLALSLCKYPNPSPEQLAAITDLLLNKSIVDPHPRNELVEYVLRKSGDETLHLRRLAECDKPWIWCRIIQASSHYRELLNKMSPSSIMRLRMVAIGMDGWIDDADAFKPQAYDLLAEAITPEFVQKGLSDFDRIFRRFAKHTSPDRGTEVLIRYLDRQLKEWNTWQVDGRASANAYGSRRAVRQINRWNNTNLGGLGSEDGNSFISEARYDWQDIAAGTLQWALTGDDQSRIQNSLRSGPPDDREMDDAQTP